MNSRSLFKLVTILITWFKVTVLSFPVMLAGVNLKKGKFQYGYDYFELDYNAAILIAIGVGIIFSVWNAFEHADREDMDEEQFMNAHQKYELINGSDFTTNGMLSALERIVQSNRRWKFLTTSSSEAPYKLVVKNFLGAKDVVTIAKQTTGWMIESRPKWRIDFIDLGRNFDNIKWLSRELNSPE